MVSGNRVRPATQHIIHSGIRSEMCVNQAIKLFEQECLQDIREVISVFKLHEKLVFGSAVQGQ